MAKAKNTPTVQAGLFDSVDVHSLAAENEQLRQRIARLQKDNRSWERSSQRLREERDQIYQARLSDVEHPLYQECKRLRQEVDALRLSLRQQVWRALSGPHGGDSVTRDTLTKLLVLAHPDKWSHPEASALTLAHELTVCINEMRKGATA